MSMLENSWGDYVHAYKFEQGEFCPKVGGGGGGGYCPYPL